MVTRDKPTVGELGIDLGVQAWRRSGDGDGAVEVALVDALGAWWVLLRVSGDRSGRVLVYSEYEWECFLDGAKGGEFDDTGTARG